MISNKKNLQVDSSDYFNATFDSIVILDGEGRIIDLNQAASSLWESSKEDLCRKMFTEFFAETYQVEEDICEHVSLDRLILKGLIKSMPLNLIVGGAKEVPIILSASLIKDFGNDGRIICVLKDMSEHARADAIIEQEKKRNAEKIQDLYDFQNSILASINDALFVVDKIGMVVKSNAKGFALLETSEKDLLKKNFKEVIGFVNIEVECFTDLVTACENGVLLDLPAVLKGEAEIPVSLTGSLFSERNGVVLLARDVRESNLLKELTLKQEQLIHAAKMSSLGELSGGIAHEVNNPLAIISGYAELIAEQLRDEVALNEKLPRLQGQLTSVKESAARITEIISHIRDFCQMSQNHMAFHSLNDVIESSFRLIKEQLINRKIHLEMNLPSEPVRIQCDARRLEQVFVNIVTNARDSLTEKYRRSGGRLEVDVEVSKDKSEVIVMFSDDGLGIGEESLGKVFDPFFTTKGVGGGTGLGLSIALGIVKDHNGNITCKTNEKGGLTFILGFPLIPDEG